MQHVQLTRELTELGFSKAEIARMVRSAELVRLRRGAYLPATAGPAADLRERHRLAVQATVRICSPALVVSHMSAAALHGLPVWRDELTRVQLTRDRPRGTKRSRSTHIRSLRLADDDIVVIDGIAVTSLARTVLDLACQFSMDRAVAIGDAALRLDLDPAELDAQLAAARGRHGIAAARRTMAFLDRRAESVGESRSRVLLHLEGVPTPELQMPILDPTEQPIAWADFAWPKQRTIGEFDGKVKYSTSLRPGHDPVQELFAEKRREDVIRELGWRVVRWVNDDLKRPALLARRVVRALNSPRRV